MSHLQRTVNIIATKIKFKTFRKSLSPNLYHANLIHTTTNVCDYHFKRWYAPMLIEFKKRVEKLKFQEMHPNELYPAPIRKEFSDWNYDAEIYAMGKRLNEQFNDQLLREALTDSSYIFHETQKLKEAGVTQYELSLRSNNDLADAGRALIEDYSIKFLRSTCPLLPEEGIRVLTEYLSSEEILGKVAEQLGFKDLILTKEYPPSTQTYAKSLAAVVGCLNLSSGLERCRLFIKDIVVVQLVGKDLWDIWQIEDPLHVVSSILQRSGRGEAEPRLIGELGRNTLESVFHIGIYDASKELVGKGYGETINTGVKVAAYDALSRMFGQTNARSPLPFKDRDISFWMKNEPNTSLNEWTEKSNIS